MTIPAAMHIEMALDTMKDEGMCSDDVVDELKEFLEASGVEVLQIAFPDNTPDVAKGYLLGLTVARVMLRLNPVAMEAGVTL